MKRIPGLAPGILFLLAACAVHASPLAWDLYTEGNWPACAIEAKRILIQHPGDDTARFLLSASSARLNQDTAACSNLLALARTASTPELRARAALEASRMLLAGATPADAWAPASTAFLSATDSETFLQSLAILAHLHRHSIAGLHMAPALEQQYRTCEPLLRHVPDTWLPPRPDSVARRIGSAPGRLIVAFYRRCIRPAIGDRCVLSPNCSEYFLLATRQHGLLGIPMLADRLVREPSVVAAARYPMTRGQHTVYHDPLEHHDFWMTPP